MRHECDCGHTYATVHGVEACQANNHGRGWPDPVANYERWVEAVWGDTGPGKAREHIQRLTRECDGDVNRALHRMALEFQDLRENFICTVGLCEEAGEVAGPIKKNVRNPVKHPLDRDKIVDECGDVLYYLVKKLHSVGGTIAEAMAVNQAKINGRYGTPAGYTDPAPGSEGGDPKPSP